MANVDIDPFGDHDKTDEPMGENIPLTPLTGGDQLGNQNVNKKHHSEEGQLKKEGSPILMSTVCTRTNEPQMKSIMITLDAKLDNFRCEACNSKQS